MNNPTLFASGWVRICAWCLLAAFLAFLGGMIYATRTTAVTPVWVTTDYDQGRMIGYAEGEKVGRLTGYAAGFLDAVEGPHGRSIY